VLDFGYRNESQSTEKFCGIYKLVGLLRSQVLHHMSPRHPPPIMRFFFAITGKNKTQNDYQKNKK
jgi:hypothetical protein